MGSQWNPLGFQLQNVFCLVVLISLFKTRQCWSLNLEGLALLNFRANVQSDPYGIFKNWNRCDNDPCMWSRVHCEDGKVIILNLSGLSLEGTLSPEIGKLSHLKSLILCKNHFVGDLPKDFGDLTGLELLDLSSNNLSGEIPAEIGQLLSLKRLLLCNNKFHGSIPLELGNLNMLSEIQFDQNLTFAVDSGIRCLHRKFGHCIWQKDLDGDSMMIQFKRKFKSYAHVLPWFSRKSSLNVCGDHYCENLSSSAEPYLVQNTEQVANLVRRKLLQDSSNLEAILPDPDTIPAEPLTTVQAIRSSGSFPAIPVPQTTSQPSAHPANPAATTSPPSSGKGIPLWVSICVGIGVAFLLLVAAVMLFMCRGRKVKTIRPWKTGLSGQLQKAFVTGVPKLNRSELESACEDFSNIIDNFEQLTIYKGTLSSGVEIAVASTAIKEYKDWSARSEMAYRKKIDTLSRVNHKNFVNLLGYCEEDKPFSRMMVFEYAPSGSLFEHLHVKEIEHLDWNARMRIIMGVAYCLQYVHELDPPVALGSLKSSSILLSDDFAAKVSDIGFWAQITQPRSKTSGELESSVLSVNMDPETNIYNFGLLLLEIITGKLPYSETQGPLLNWASEYMNDKRYMSSLTDPTLQTFKNAELDVVCDVIKECVHQDPRQRPKMRQVISKLREVITVSPEAATPRLSPLWWAELEILSVEAT